MILDIARALGGRGPLHLDSAARARLDALIPTFRVVGSNPFEAALLAGIAWTESHFVATARNAQTGAAGLMQIMPAHFSRLGWRGTDWQNPEANIAAGRAILTGAGLGVEPIDVVLARYGGFKNADPNNYVSAVLDRALFLVPDMFVG